MITLNENATLEVRFGKGTVVLAKGTYSDHDDNIVVGLDLFNSTKSFDVNPNINEVLECVEDTPEVTLLFPANEKGLKSLDTVIAALVRIKNGITKLAQSDSHGEGSTPTEQVQTEDGLQK